MKKYLAPLIGIAMIIISCENSEKTSIESPEKEEEISTEELVLTEEVSPIPEDLTSPTPLAITVEDTVLLLFPGDYSDGSIQDYALHNNWEALKRNGEYLEGTIAQIETTPIEDPWGEEGNQEGIRISDMSKQPVTVYISGINNIVGINMKDLSEQMPNKRLLPGESFKIGEFTLTATGNKEGDDDYPQVSNYSLVLSGINNGQYIEQEILFQEYFDDAMINFHWIGDLDQDGIPDMLIDTSHKYSYSNPTLFLSSPSDKNSLVKKVAESTRFGC